MAARHNEEIAVVMAEEMVMDHDKVLGDRATCDSS